MEDIQAVLKHKYKILQIVSMILGGLIIMILSFRFAFNGNISRDLPKFLIAINITIFGLAIAYNAKTLAEIIVPTLNEMPLYIFLIPMALYFLALLNMNRTNTQKRR